MVDVVWVLAEGRCVQVKQFSISLLAQVDSGAWIVRQGGSTEGGEVEVEAVLDADL